ncbi:MAG: M20 family metallo-hydrolase [Deltaproteobacteria bacterium]|nr:M20 family metallo-hydrolase [Deltaproteobacteria bacterium]
MSIEQFEKIAGRLDGYRDLVVKLQTDLTAIPAISPKSGGKGERRKTAYVRTFLESLGIEDLESRDAPDPEADGGVRPNLIARIPGRDPSRTLWIMSHVDVVPPGDESKWSSPPWEARLDGDRIYGRGVEDNQQGMVASMILAKAFTEEGITPHWNIALLFVADEEVGSTFGIQYLVKEGNPFSPDDLVVVPDGGEPDGSMIEVAEKAILWTRFRVIGKMTHGSTPERGINASRAAAHLITFLDGLYEDFPEKQDVFDPPISTFEPTKREPNVENVNTVPGEDVFFMDARILPSTSLDEVKAKMRSYCDRIAERFKVEVEMDHPMQEEAAPPTDPESPVVHALAPAIEHVYGVKARPMGIGGGTVAAYIRRSGIPAVVWARMDETLHGFDEYVLIPNIIGDAKVFAFVALKPW